VIVIGLTGGIASGKSTAARYLQGKGAHLIDADQLGHRAYEPGMPANLAIVRAFGGDVRSDDGTIDRRALGAKVFGDPSALKRLTDIVWPEIRRMAEAQIVDIKADAPDAIVVLEAAVLLEAEWEAAVDRIWVVLVEPDVAVERAMNRDGMDAQAVQKRLDAQLSNAQRTARATVVIDNSADEQCLYKVLDQHWSSLGAVS
jgi:phosphopantetheine adenylyltransferase/dephospho-CoA kinase